MPYRAIITILIPAFFIYATTLSIINPSIAYAGDEAITHFEPEKIEPPANANEPVQPEEKKGISKWWYYVLIGLVVIGGGAAAAGKGGGGGGTAPSGGGGGTVGVSW